MKKAIISVMLLVMVLSLFGCSDSTDAPNIVGDAQLTSKLENSIELQKSIFIGEVISVSRQDALIAKYNSDITNYSVYTVNITESLDGYTPTGEALVYCMGTSEEFIQRVGLKQGERYIIDAEPWVYGDRVIYLLAPVTVAFPRIDTANRVTLAISDTEAEDCGTLEEYRAEFEGAKASVEARIPGFFESSQVLERYVSMFENINTVTEEKWIRDFNYSWTPDEELMNKTKNYAAQVYEYVKGLEGKDVLTDTDLQNIFKVGK